MAEIEFTGIRKDNGNHDNPYEAIESFQWKNYATGNSGMTDMAGAIKWLEDGNQAYVERVRPRAYCFVNVSARGRKFVQTRADETDQNNLLKLPEV